MHDRSDQFADQDDREQSVPLREVMRVGRNRSVAAMRRSARKGLQDRACAPAGVS